MARDPKLEAEERRRVSQHENVKNQLRDEVNQEITDELRAETPSERDEVHRVGRELKRRAVAEVKDTEREIRRGRALARGAQVVDYVFFVTYGLIALEIVLEATGARESNDFKQLVDALTLPILAPFRTLFPSIAHGPFRIMVSYVAALVVYLMLHLAIRGLIRMIGRRRVEI